MAYMVFQQYTTAIKEAYRGRPDVARHLETAQSCREWLQSLEIDPEVRATLVEQFKAIEEAFRDLVIEAERR